MLIVKNKYNKFQTPCNSRDRNNNPITYWMYVNFKKGTEPTKDKIGIEPKKWWFNCYVDQNSVTHPTMFITEWDEVSDEEKPKEAKESVDRVKPQEMTFEQDSLPFY